MQENYGHANAGMTENVQTNSTNRDENYEPPPIMSSIYDLFTSPQRADRVQGGEREVVLREKARQLFHLQNTLLASIAETVEFREENTGGHVNRLCCYLKLLLDQMIVEGIYWDEIITWDLDIAIPSAQLHDLGKIVIPDKILNKPGKLSAEEFEIVKSHAAMGVEIIRSIEEKTQGSTFLHHARVIAGTHHEKWDGSGYPLGLKGYRIPLEGRLLALADVYDALVTERPYKRAFSFERANKIINEAKGLHFDPLLVDVFNVVSGRFAQIALAYCGNDATLKRI
jgi:putative two-component system response regulator